MAHCCQASGGGVRFMRGNPAGTDFKNDVRHWAAVAAKKAATYC